ncbi:MAG: hypothetical protein K2Q09_03680, partial [Phycisphaerales bacterium]|nr:hypothetical protein [Phycisphaerales bacterium]
MQWNIRSSCGIAVTVYAATGAAVGGSPPLLDWIRFNADASSRLPRVVGMVQWRTEEVNRLTASEIAELRLMVRNHPEHPRKGELEATETRLREGQTSTRTTLFVDGRGSWRFNFDASDQAFVDTVVRKDGGDAWSFSGSEVRLFDSAAVEKGTDPRQDARGLERAFGPEADLLFYAGIQRAKSINLTLAEAVENRDSTWRVEFGPGGRVEGTTVRLLVGIGSRPGRFRLLERSLIERSGNLETVAGRERAVSWAEADWGDVVTEVHVFDSA